jgi:hypothetical protein
MAYNNERKSFTTFVSTTRIVSRLSSLRIIINKSMTNSKKISITTVSRETLIIRLKEDQSVTGFCRACGVEALMLDINSAVTIFWIGTRELMRLAESGALHSMETPSGHLLVCENSLKAFERESK